MPAPLVTRIQVDELSPASGTAGQVPTINAGGTAVEYQTPTGGGGGGLSVTTKGDVQGYSSVAARIPVGTDGQALIADSAQTLGLKYRNPLYRPSNIITLANGVNDVDLTGTAAGELILISGPSGAFSIRGVKGMRAETVFVNVTTQAMTVTDSGSPGVGYTAISAPGAANLVITGVGGSFTINIDDNTGPATLRVTSFTGGTTYTASTGVKITGTLITLDVPGLTQDTAPDPTADYIPEIDFSASTHKKVLIGDLPFIQQTPATEQTADIKLKGQMKLFGATSGFTALKAAAAAGSALFQLPSADGSSGQALTTNGSGVLSFATFAGGGGSGNISNSTNLGSEPGGSTGDLNFSRDGIGTHRYASGSWATDFWGPSYRFTPPPTLTSSQATTLSANINNAVTSLTFVSGSGWPTVPFLMQIGTEDFKVTALNTGTGVATVVRGYNGTTAASHTAGDAITQLNWEWVNKGATSTVTTITNEGFYLDGGTDSAAHNLRMFKRLIVNTTSGDVQVPVSPAVAITGAATPLALGEVGIFMRESATGKIMRLGCYSSGSGAAPAILISNYASPTGSPSNQFYGYTYNPSMTWLRMSIVGANIVYRMSFNAGLKWITLLTVAKTSGFTTAPDEWGVEANSLSTTQTSGVGVYGFLES